MAEILTMHQKMGTSPVWSNPNLWPGDKNGNPVQPVTGRPCYLWAAVANTGNADANVTVQFYWGNPSLAMVYGNMTMVGYGSGFVSAGGAQNIVCIQPWTPVYVNGGHECLVAICGSLFDPPPPSQSNNIVDANDAQTAQHNVTTVQASSTATQVSYRIQLPAAAQSRGAGTVQARRVPVQQFSTQLLRKGVAELPGESPEGGSFYLATSPGARGALVDPANLGTSVPVIASHDLDLLLVVDLPERRQPGTGALYTVEYDVDGENVGGVAVLVVQ
jgi:hypothetical protein